VYKRQVFYRGKAVEGGTVSIFFSAVDPRDGSVTGPVPVMSASHDISRIVTSLSPTIYPFALLTGLRLEEDYALRLNFAESGGTAAPGPGNIIDYNGATDRSSIGGDGDSLGVAWTSSIGDKYRFAVVGQDGLISSTRSLDYDEILDEPFTLVNSIVIPVPGGYTVMAKHSLRETDTDVFTMQTLDLDCEQVLSPRLILEEADTNFLTSAAWSGECYAIVFVDHQAPDSIVRNLFFALVDPGGEILKEPFAIGTIFIVDYLDGSVVWTGSEFAVAFAEPSLPVEYAPRVLKVARLDGEGNMKGDAKVIYDGQDVNRPGIAWNGSVYGIAWIGPVFPHYNLYDWRIHFALAGCIEPED